MDKELFQWCAKHRISVTLEDVDEVHSMVKAEFGPISSESLFKSKEELAEGLLFVLDSVKAGFEYHMKNGFVPKVPQ